MFNARFPNTDTAASHCLDFLRNFINAYDENKGEKYVNQLQKIANRESRILRIELDDVEQFFSEGDGADPGFVTEVEKNTRRYVKLFAEAADKIMPGPSVDLSDKMDVFDILSEHRRYFDNLNQSQAGASGQNAPASFNPQSGGGAATGAQPPAGAAPAGRFPPGVSTGKCPESLLRRFDTYIVPRSKSTTLNLRKVTSAQIGRLIKVRGVVTHASDVRPLASIVTYTDPESGLELYQEVQGRTFKPLDFDSKELARTGRRRMMPIMETRGSKFVKYQEARIQEMADEVPEGSTPRSMPIQLRGEVTRSLKPGDEVTVSGIYLPEPYSGMRGMRAGLLVSTYLEATDVVQARRKYGVGFTLSENEVDQIQHLAAEGDVYTRLACSIAPEIFGWEDVKKALLLIMVGGVSKSLPDGLKLRGDIHMCMMGDPGVAKSQLLKYISRVTPRAVYTTGKGSSGVGLTAAVLRHPVTRELVLEGGALVLADRGICCIDEFDKMEDGDRTAIHEVMEQQTVSIAKAGITTTLNTRTTVLSAANPAYGRYDRRRTPSENINLPAALLSRFDLLWLMLDEPDRARDMRLARHVMSVHLTGKVSTSGYADGSMDEDAAAAAADALSTQLPPVDQKLLRAYVGYARSSFQPHVPTDLTEYISSIYANLRQLEKQAVGASATYTTPRTLLSILRLSQALARLKFADSVCMDDVDEALRLMRMSKASLSGDRGTQADDGDAPEDPVTLTYGLISNYCEQAGRREVGLAKILELTATHHQIKRADIDRCLQVYHDINRWNLFNDDSGAPVISMVEHEDLP